jgi:hypothetical protein
MWRGNARGDAAVRLWTPDPALALRDSRGGMRDPLVGANELNSPLENRKVRLRGMPFTLFTRRITLRPYPSSWEAAWHAPEQYVSETESGSMI